MTLQADLQRAFQLFQQGQAQAAENLCQNLLRQYPNQPDCLHLRALCLKAMQQWQAAEMCFKQALQLMPHSAQIMTNYANLLSELGRHQEAVSLYSRIVTMDPNQINAWVGGFLASLQLGHLEAAKKHAESFTNTHPMQAVAWECLGSACRKLEDLPNAESAYERATEIAPQNGKAWLNLAVVKRLLGKSKQAEPCAEKARQSGLQGPELLDVEASLMLDKGMVNDAIAAYKSICQAYPDYVLAYDALTKILWEYYPDDNPLAPLKAASDQNPQHIGLQLSYVRHLLESEQWQPALDKVTSLKEKIHPGYGAYLAGQSLSGLGQDKEAYDTYKKAISYIPDDLSLRNSFAHFLLKIGRPEEMIEHAKLVTERKPDDQIAWAYLGTAWRLIGDQREHWLHQYDDLIVPLEVDVPDHFNSRADFCKALKAALEPMHMSTHEPIDQSLNNGTQTGSNLFGYPEGVIKDVRDAIQRTVQTYQQGLPNDPEHPFLSRKGKDIYFQGAWSVRLRSSGFHKNHVHNKGWLSSAFYVDLPASVKQSDGHDKSGWISFGQPLHTLGLDLEPRRYIQPKEGTIAVFPSYTWHGTVPFNDDHHRLTMAFDMVPIN